MPNPDPDPNDRPGSWQNIGPGKIGLFAGIPVPAKIIQMYRDCDRDFSYQIFEIFIRFYGIFRFLYKKRRRGGKEQRRGGEEEKRRLGEVERKRKGGEELIGGGRGDLRRGRGE